MHRGHKGGDDYAAQQQVLQEHLMQVGPARNVILHFCHISWGKSVLIVDGWQRVLPDLTFRVWREQSTSNMHHLVGHEEHTQYRLL